MNKKYYVSESAFINVSCALAKRMMEERLGDKYPLMFEEHGNSYNEEGQEHFNQLYDKVQNILEDADIVPNDVEIQISLTRLENAVKDIKENWITPNDFSITSHTNAEYKGMYMALDMLVKHFKEINEEKKYD